MIKIHKEGYLIFAISSSILIFMGIFASLLLSHILWILIPLLAFFAFMIVFIARFFRVPNRKMEFNDELFYSPADGKVVVIEETTEVEYFKDKRIQLSIFMSVWNVHLNFFPFSGKVKYYKYHPGKFLLAIHPKSSTLNERTTVVIEDSNKKSVLLRQIAGAVARRIICYAKVGNSFSAGDELGFIKFGSRVDIFFPAGTKILVNQGDTVYGSRTPLAEWKN
ncbi:MAG: phosphatidylserine decarboxylase family protein [Bacteroidales bacterium]|nr:phosphatidylserine decarboxylase family protein [Bacteroidales bacterium]MCB9000245.1 phosphatidylserine decarboxylase family protein [Bacteroidales bacterium]MCB9013364.1 phosphatidylserine decarboxylase family protein [Bacteroidales bacterium]